MSCDVFTFGEAMLRLSSPPGTPLQTTHSLDVHVAGAEANVASALAQLGRRVVWASRLPQNDLARRILSSLSGAGVDCSGVALGHEGRVGTYYVDLQAEPIPTRIIYDRANSSFGSVTPEDIPWHLVAGARIIHLSGITPPLSPSATDVAMRIAREAVEQQSLLSFDVNYRARLWSSEEARAALGSFLEIAHLVVCSKEDAGHVFGIDGEAEEVATTLSERFGARHVVVTDGQRGAAWLTGDGAGRVEAKKTEVIDRIGAGDAFTAGVIDGLLDGDISRGVEQGVALASIALTTHGDQISVGRDLMDSLVSGEGRSVDR